MEMKCIMRLFSLICVVSLLAGCAARTTPREALSRNVMTDITPRGTIIFNGEYEFTPPPAPWEMLRGNETSHYVVGFFREDAGSNYLQSSFFAYDEEPYGFSRNLEDRAKECLKRYFWASILSITVLENKKVNVLGREGLAVTLEGKDTVKKVKVKSKLVFMKRGERVVAFYLNQWRPLDEAFDKSAFDSFDTFVKSFTFLKKSFYETL